MRAITAVLILAVGPAFAEPLALPKADVDGWCRYGLDLHAKNERRSAEQQYQDCFSQAQADYDWLKGFWPTLSPAQQVECAPPEWKEPTQHTYHEMRRCAEIVERARAQDRQYNQAADDSARARQTPPKREFRY